MAQPVGDLVVDLNLDAAKFQEQIERVKKSFGETGTAANDAALQLQQSFTRQEVAAKRAGISVGQYNAAIRMLPAQFTDIATQLAGGQSPWLILLQQGGQVKDSFGGFGAMFQALRDALLGFSGDAKKGSDDASSSTGDLAEGVNNVSESVEKLGHARGFLTPLNLSIVGVAAAAGVMAYAFYKSNSLLSDFNKSLVLSGNTAGLTADEMLAVSKSAAATGMTFSTAAETLTALVKAGVGAGANFEQLTVSIAEFADKSGVKIDAVAGAFGRLTSSPTQGLAAMAQQFHNVTAEQIAYVAQLERSGDSAGALNAANEAATQGFDKQTRAIEANMGTLEKAANAVGDAFKSMWDKALDIGRQDSSEQMLKKAQDAFNNADKIWNLRKNDSYVNDDARASYWTAREQARVALDMAQQQARNSQLGLENAKREASAEADKLKYSQQAQANYTKSQSAIEKYTARQNELNKALKEGRIVQADYNVNMAAAKKEYEDSLKKPKSNRVKVSAGDQGIDTGSAETLTLQTQLDVLSKHAGINDRISQQRQNQWELQSKIAILEKIQNDPKGRALTLDEQSVLANKEKLLTQAEINARLGDQVVKQKQLNTLADQATKFAQQQSSKRAEIDARANGQSSREAGRKAMLERLGDAYAYNPAAQQQVLAEQQKTYDAEDALRSSWQAGAKNSWTEYADSAGDAYGQMMSVGTATFDGLGKGLSDMLLTGKSHFSDFTKSILGMLTQILIKQSLVSGVNSLFGLEANANGGVYSSTSLSAYSGQVVSRPTLFAFAKGAGVMGEAGPEAILPLRRGANGKLGVVAGSAGGSINIQSNVYVQGDKTTSQTTGSDDAVGRAYQQAIDSSIQDGIRKALRPGGIIWNAQQKR